MDSNVIPFRKPTTDTKYPAYVEITVQMNVASEDEFQAARNRISSAARMGVTSLKGDAENVRVSWNRWNNTTRSFPLETT